MARQRDDQLHKDRRQQILLAAASVFRRKGFHAARTEEICREAGLSTGSLFRYFRDKDAIIGAIVEAEMQAYRDLIGEVFTPEGLVQLTRLDVAGLRELLMPSPYSLSTEAWIELYRNPLYRERTLEYDRTIRQLLLQSIDAAQAAGRLRPDLDAGQAAALLEVMCNGVTASIELDVELDLPDLAAGLADLLKRYLLPA